MKKRHGRRHKTIARRCSLTDPVNSGSSWHWPLGTSAENCSAGLRRPSIPEGRAPRGRTCEQEISATCATGLSVAGRLPPSPAGRLRRHCTPAPVSLSNSPRGRFREAFNLDPRRAQHGPASCPAAPLCHAYGLQPLSWCRLPARGGVLRAGVIPDGAGVRCRLRGAEAAEVEVEAQVGEEAAGLQLYEAEFAAVGQTKPHKGSVHSNGKSGKAALYYEWDHTHNDIEVYGPAPGYKHLGSMDPSTGQIYKRPVEGRNLRGKLK